jgi:membrane protease YdiL (CAAX protease family)
MTAGSWSQRRPLLAYFGLTYVISWGCIALVLGATGFDLARLRPVDTGLIFVSMLLGPSVSGLVMTARLEGRAGLRRLWLSLARWEVGARWYALALLLMPVLLLAVLLPLAAFLDPAFAPGFKWQLLVIGLVAGSFEELGWTGFATPRLLARQRPFMAGLSLGLGWALWHVLVDFRQNFSSMSPVWLLEFAVFYLAALTAYRVLMTWVYSNTQSLPLAMLMHASYTGWLVVLYPATSFEQGLVWQTALAVVLWLAVAVVMLWFEHREPPRASLPGHCCLSAGAQTAESLSPSLTGYATSLHGRTVFRRLP